MAPTRVSSPPSPASDKTAVLVPLVHEARTVGLLGWCTTICKNGG